MTTTAASEIAAAQGRNWLAFWRLRIKEYWWLGTVDRVWRL